MKKIGVKIVALEQDERSVTLDGVREKMSGISEILLIPGNEVGGVEGALLDASDVIAEIPMHGTKESLNVSVATGIALFSLFQ